MVCENHAEQCVNARCSGHNRGPASPPPHLKPLSRLAASFCLKAERPVRFCCRRPATSLLWERKQRLSEE